MDTPTGGDTDMSEVQKPILGQKTPTKEELAYMAGFFDGEGCVGISLSKRSANRRGLTYSTSVRIATTDRTAMDWIVNTFGGYLRSYKPRNQKHKLVYHWILFGQRGFIFLHQIYPYLKTKKPQAEIAFQFEQTIKPAWGHNALSIKELQLREQLKQKMGLLNLRGKPKQGIAFPLNNQMSITLSKENNDECRTTNPK